MSIQGSPHIGNLGTEIPSPVIGADLNVWEREARVDKIVNFIDSLGDGYAVINETDGYKSIVRIGTNDYYRLEERLYVDVYDHEMIEVDNIVSITKLEIGKTFLRSEIKNKLTFKECKDRLKDLGCIIEYGRDFDVINYDKQPFKFTFMTGGRDNEQAIMEKLIQVLEDVKDGR